MKQQRAAGDEDESGEPGPSAGLQLLAAAPAPAPAPAPAAAAVLRCSAALCNPRGAEDGPTTSNHADGYQ